MKRIVTMGLVSVLVFPVHAKLVHRYNFAVEGAVNDVVGSADGIICGNAVVSGGALTTVAAIGTARSGTVANGAQLDDRAVAGLTGAFTIESWVSATLENDHRYATAWAFSDATANNYLQATPARGDGWYPSAVGIKGAGGVPDEHLMTASFWDDGRIHQIVVTYDGITVSYYLDGVFMSSVTDAGFDLSALDVIGINGGSPFADYSMAGSTYDFRIYDQSLTGDQIGSIYALGQDAATARIISTIPEPEPCSGKSPIRLAVKCKSEDDEDHYEDRSDVYHIKSIDAEMEVCTMMIGLKNGGDEDVPCTLEWFFLSEDVVTDETGIFDHGKKQIMIPAGSVVKESAKSKSYVVTTESREWGDFGQYTWGEVYDGYIVLVTSGGQILAKDSNSNRYLSNEWISKYRNAR